MPITFQEILESIESLSVEDQDYLFDLIKKRRIEERRLEIAKNRDTILKDFQEGKAKIGTVDDLIVDLLEDDDNEDSLE